jgi:hypothetical protein
MCGGVKPKELPNKILKLLIGTWRGKDANLWQCEGLRQQSDAQLPAAICGVPPMPFATSIRDAGIGGGTGKPPCTPSVTLMTSPSVTPKAAASASARRRVQITHGDVQPDADAVDALDCRLPGGLI